MACIDRCHDCGQSLCENQCSCITPDYTNVGQCGPIENSNCITYNGIDDACLTIVKPIGLTSVLQKIIIYVKNIFNRVSSDSLVITTPNVCDDLKIELVPSIQSGNTLSLGSDGKPYVPTPVFPTITIPPAVYSGAGNTCLGITNNEGISSVLDKVILRTKNTATVFTSNTLGLTRNSNCTNNLLNVELIPSVDSGNILVLGTDSYPYVPNNTAVGTIIELQNAFAKQCIGLNDAPSFGGTGNMSTFPGWSVTPTTLAESLTNMWITICDMRSKINDLKDCCESSVCEDSPDITVTIL
jgi:hypothetical protein